MTISQNLIGATPKQAFKPLGTIGAASDATAPFALGTTATASDEGANPRDIAQFCRVGAATIAANATAGITNGVTVTAGAGNTWTNETGVTLAVGDYAWLTATLPTT